MMTALYCILAFIAGAVMVGRHDGKIVNNLRNTVKSLHAQLEEVSQRSIQTIEEAERVSNEANAYRERVSLYYFEEYKKQRIEYSLALAVSLGVHNMAKNGTSKDEALRIIANDVYLNEKQLLCEGNQPLYDSLDDSKVFAEALRLSECMWRTGEVKYQAAPMTIQ